MQRIQQCWQWMRDQNMIKWIKLLYTNPTAQVLTNNNISEPFKLQRSTRQGCPLSQILFTLAIEPLAIAVRTQPGLSGINIGGRKHIISLFADDLIFFCDRFKEYYSQMSEFNRRIWCIFRI